MAKLSINRLPSIFISYRREDTGGDAGRLNDTLTQILGPGRTFWDLETIAPGKHFKEELTRVLGTTDILLALIGPRWETIADANGRPRLHNRDDLVRMEVAAGLRNKAIRVVPILINRDTIPKASDLPSVLRSLLQQNEFTIRRDRWRQDVEELLNRLQISRHLTPPTAVDSSVNRQARFVSVSVEWKRKDVPDSNPRRWVVYVDNASDAPITVERVDVTTPMASLTIDWGTVRSKETSDYELEEEDFAPSGDRPDALMRFLDADGHKWKLRRGVLTRIRATSAE